MEDKFKKWVEAKLESELPAADAERAMDYADDLLHGLKTIRTYPQGVVIYGSARLKPNDKYAVAARELGGMLARNGHAVITGGGPGIMEAAHLTLPTSSSSNTSSRVKSCSPWAARFMSSSQVASVL